MTAGYRLTVTAEGDLDEILRYVAERDGLEQALHLHERLTESFEQLASMPLSGSRRPDLSGNRVRWWSVFRWAVIYDPETEPLTILRVIHGGREIGRVLREGS